MPWWNLAGRIFVRDKSQGKEREWSRIRKKLSWNEGSANPRSVPSRTLKQLGLSEVLSISLWIPNRHLKVLTPAAPGLTLWSSHLGEHLSPFSCWSLTPLFSVTPHFWFLSGSLQLDLQNPDLDPSHCFPLLPWSSWHHLMDIAATCNIPQTLQWRVCSRHSSQKHPIKTHKVMSLTCSQLIWIKVIVLTGTQKDLQEPLKLLPPSDLKRDHSSLAHSPPSSLVSIFLRHAWQALPQGLCTCCPLDTMPHVVDRRCPHPNP